MGVEGWGFKRERNKKKCPSSEITQYWDIFKCKSLTAQLHLCEKLGSLLHQLGRHQCINEQPTGLIVPFWFYLSSWIYFTKAISEVTAWKDDLSSLLTAYSTVHPETNRIKWRLTPLVCKMHVKDFIQHQQI